MAVLNNITDVIGWVKRDLGVPVLCIELPDLTLTQIVEDTISDFQRYAFTEGAYEDYIPLNVSAGVSAYNLSGVDISTIVELKSPSSNSSLDSTFSAQANIVVDEFINSSGQGLNLANFENSSQYADLANSYFKTIYQTMYRPGKEELLLVPTPKVNFTGLLHVYKKEAPLYIFNNPNFKKLLRARVMIRWGFVLNKRQITFPGGGTVNGQWIYDEGKTLEEKMEKQIIDENKPPMFMIG